MEDLNPRYLGDGWQVNPHSSAAPRVRYEHGKLMMNPGASSLRIGNTTVDGSDVEVPPGSIVRLGQYTKLRVDAVVKSTLEVKSVFGIVARTREKVVVTPPLEEGTAARELPKRTTFALRGDE
jgi:hypothetical protein